MKKRNLIKIIGVIGISLVLNTGCKKDNEKFCWRLNDCNGFNLPDQCDKTEAEIKAIANSNPACVSIYKKL
jgi:hypothetical protein